MSLLRPQLPLQRLTRPVSFARAYAVAARPSATVAKTTTTPAAPKIAKKSTVVKAASKSKPVVSKPITTAAAAPKTVAAKAPATKPVATKTTAAKPIAAKPVAPKPVVPKAVAPKPVAPKPVAATPAAAKPTAYTTPKPYAPSTAVRKTAPAPQPSAPAPPPKKPLDPNSHEYQKSYNSLARRWLAGLIAAPVFLVTSYYLYDRLILGNERKVFEKEPPVDERDPLAKTI